jgi:hypothetical protein
MRKTHFYSLRPTMTPAKHGNRGKRWNAGAADGKAAEGLWIGLSRGPG